MGVYKGPTLVAWGPNELVPLDGLDPIARGMLDQPWPIVSANLNSVIETAVFIHSTADSTTALNYPANGLAGLLEVRTNAEQTMAWQRFTSTTGRVWVRSYSGGVWQAWAETSGGGGGAPVVFTSASFASGWSTPTTGPLVGVDLVTGVKYLASGLVGPSSATTIQDTTWTTIATTTLLPNANLNGVGWHISLQIPVLTRWDTSGAVRIMTIKGTAVSIPAVSGTAYILIPSGVTS